MDRENLPPAKRELLRQMSSPNKSKDDSRANLNRKVQTNIHSVKSVLIVFYFIFDEKKMVFGVDL